MTDHNDFEPEPAESIIARARNTEPPVMALPGQPDDCEQDAWMESAFTALPASDLFDPAVLAAVELLMNDYESVTVRTRQRLVDGADRGVRWRHRLDNRLGNLLREHRCARQLSPGDIAARIGADASLITEIETGAKPAHSLTAEQVAAWIRYVRLEHGAALAALRDTPPLGKVPEQDADLPADGFTCDVAAALGRSSGRC
jgi:Helix-turn-helix domain